jgi:hypothetical protein
MDERIPVEEALGLSLGGGRIFRNAGDLDGVDLDPALPELTIGGAGIGEWFKMADDITRNRKFLVNSRNA